MFRVQSAVHNYRFSPLQVAKRLVLEHVRARRPTDGPDGLGRRGARSAIPGGGNRAKPRSHSIGAVGSSALPGRIHAKHDAVAVGPPPRTTTVRQRTATASARSRARRAAAIRWPGHLHGTRSWQEVKSTCHSKTGRGRRASRCLPISDANLPLVYH